MDRLEELGPRKQHVKTCLEVLEEIIPEPKAKGRIWKTMLNHDIGYEYQFNGISDHNISGYMVTLPAEDINSKAILMHGKMKDICLLETNIDILETYIIDYCDIHSTNGGLRCDIDARYEDITHRHGIVPQDMIDIRQYYEGLDRHIYTTVENYLRGLDK